MELVVAIDKEREENDRDQRFGQRILARMAVDLGEKGGKAWFDTCMEEVGRCCVNLGN